MFYYYDLSSPFMESDVACHVAMVPAGYRDIRELLTEVGRLLGFPPYYGKNLDAFWDCLTGLEALAARRVLLAHRDVPGLPGRELGGYLHVLRDGVAYWDRPGALHTFEVWFPADARPLVSGVLGDA